MVEIVRDEDILKDVAEFISVVGITDSGIIIRDFEKSEEGDISQVPEEYRRYIHQETMQELPKGLIIYRGVRNGVYIDLRQLKLVGMSDEEIDNIVGNSKTPEQAQQHAQRANISRPHRAAGVHGQDDTELDPSIARRPDDNKLDFHEDDPTRDEQRNDRLSRLGRMLLEKYGIEIVMIKNKGSKSVDGESLVGEKVQIGGLNHTSKIKMIFCLDSRIIEGGGKFDLPS